MARQASWRGLKRHRSYTYDEAARAIGKHRNTVKSWAKSGDLSVLKQGTPHLILGSELIAFLHTRKADAKTKLRLGEMYCLRCKAARLPAEGMVEALPSTGGAVNLRGLCGVCTGVIHRRVAPRDMAQFMAALDAAASTAA